MGDEAARSQGGIPIPSLDLDKKIPKGSMDLVETGTTTRESLEELLARLKREEAKNQHELDEAAKESQYRRDTAIAETNHRHRTVWFVFIALTLIGIGCILVIIAADDPENQALARNAIFTVVGALVGYLGGSVSNPIKKP